MCVIVSREHRLQEHLINLKGYALVLISVAVSNFEFQRGKPFRRTSDEMNPFVAREEFLMNRIVRKSDAAPPWVELQKGMRSNFAFDIGAKFHPN